jgi:hypothetical protein
MMGVVSQSQDVLQRLMNALLNKSSHSSLIKNNRQLLRDTDVILQSYPRSGNSWTRFLIADMILQHHGFATETELPIDSTTVVPSIYTQDLATIWDSRLNQAPYRVIKSHEHKDVGPRRQIYIFREAADVLVSFYYFRLNHPNANEVAKVTNKTAEQFCQQEIDRWIDHLEQAIQRYQEDSQSLCWVCYEKLHKAPQETLEKVANFLELDRSVIDIAKAVENHSHGNRVKSVKETAEARQITFNLRSGSVGKNRQALNAEVQALIYEKTRDTYEKAFALA